jgi:hypothetical protein
VKTAALRQISEPVGARGQLDGGYHILGVPADNGGEFSGLGFEGSRSAAGTGGIIDTQSQSSHCSSNIETHVLNSCSLRQSRLLCNQEIAIP